MPPLLPPSISNATIEYWLLMFLPFQGSASGRSESSTRALPESPCVAYIAAIVRNNRKEVIQCLIVYRRGRRHS
jgi:hypothetical protein